MYDLREDLRIEAAKKIAVKVIASKKLTFEEIAEACGLPLEEVEALAVNQPA